MVTLSSLTSEQHQALTQLCSSRPPSQFSPSAFLRDLAVRGYSLGCTDQQILIFARKQVATRPGLKTFLGQQTPRKRVMASAMRCARNSLPEAAPKNAQRVGRLLVGRLLSEITTGTPLKGSGVEDDLDDEAWADAILEAPKTAAKPLSPAVQLRARVVLAVVGLDLIGSINSELGWATTQMSYRRTNLLTGWTTGTSKKALNDLVQMALVSELATARKATARRFKLNRGLNPTQREVAAGQYETTGVLMGREGAQSLACDLIKSVAHSAWNYGPSPLGHRAWLVAVADAGSIDPLTLSISKRNVALDRKALLAAGLTVDMTGAELGAVLDAYSRETGALEAKREAEEAYRQAADERTAEVKRFQGLKADARNIVDELAGTFEAIPKTAVFGGRKFIRWIESTREAFAGREYPVDLATVVHTELGRRIGGRMRDADAGKIVGGWMTSSLVVEGELHARRVLAMKAARGLDLYAPLMSIPNGEDELAQKRFLQELRGSLNALPAMSEGMRAAISEDLRARLTVRQWNADNVAKGAVWAVRDIAVIPAAGAVAA